MKRTIILLSILGLAACLLVPAVASAQTPTSPQLGGCLGAFCINPSVLVPAVVRFDTKASTFQLVPALGGCYGVSYHQEMWWSPGLDACVSVQLAKDLPNQVIPAVLVKFMGIRAGVDLRLTQQTGAPLDKDIGVLFTYGFDVGGSPAYLAKKTAEAKGQP